MYFDQFYFLSKIFCASPCARNPGNAFIADESVSYKIRFTFYTLAFCFLSIYIRIYSSIKSFLEINESLTLNNYIYLANALLSTVLIILQMFIKRRNAKKIAKVNNDLLKITKSIRNGLLIQIRRMQFTFLLAIIAILYFINSEVHRGKTATISNFINETFIEIISFTDAFEYFNNTLVILLGFNHIASEVKQRGFNETNWGLFLKLLDSARRVNGVQAVGISATVAFIFIWTMFDAYVFFGILLTREYTGWRDFIRCAPWVILHSFKLLILLAVPGLCKDKGERIKALIFRNVAQDDVDKSINRYIAVMNQKINFTAYNDWFQLDYTFALSMCGTIATYLILLYQFTNVSI